MVSIDEVDRQLKRIGANFQYWGRSEIRELKHILVPGENIQGCLNGRYEGGFALLCVTDQRLLLVDKKPMYLTLEDLRYDMITEVDYGHRLLNSTISVYTPNKNLVFTAFNRNQLRAITGYIQHRVMEIRQHQTNQEAQLARMQAGMLQPQQMAAPIQAPVSLQPATALASATSDPAVGAIESLPLPRFQNPYTKQSLRYRRRVSPFTR